MVKLPDYLVEHLLETLRRDMRCQELEAIQNRHDTLYHEINARRDRALLEMLRPKAPSLPTRILNEQDAIS